MKKDDIKRYKIKKKFYKRTRCKIKNKITTKKNSSLFFLLSRKLIKVVL